MITEDYVYGFKSSSLDICNEFMTDLDFSHYLIVDAINTVGNNLDESIKHLSETISSYHIPSDSISAEDFFFAVLIAIIGAFSAYLFNYFHWRMVRRKDKLSGIFFAFNSLIKEFESIAIEYWLIDYNAKQMQHLNMLEVSIKSRVRLINRYTRLLRSKKLTPVYNVSILDKIENFGDAVFDLATGGEFESKNRVSSKSTAIKISNLCSDIRAQITSLDTLS